jgi:hypothetical protein
VGSGTVTITAVVDNADSTYTLTIDSSTGMAVGDHFGAQISSGDGGIYTIDAVPDGTSVTIGDDLDEENAGVDYGPPKIGSGWFSTPTSGGLSLVPYSGVGWDAAHRRNYYLLARVDPMINGGRLTLATNDPTVEAGPSSSLYFAEFKGNQIALYDGTVWKSHDIGGYVQLDVTGFPSGGVADTNYDIWLYDNSGTLTMEALAWSSDTTRATAPVRQDGVPCKTGALTRRYLGSVRLDASKKLNDNPLLRMVQNWQNRVGFCDTLDDSGSRSITSATAATTGSALYKMEYLVGMALAAGDQSQGVSVTASLLTNPGNTQTLAAGFGYDSATSFDTGQTTIMATPPGTSGTDSFNISVEWARASYAASTVGYHYVELLALTSGGTSYINNSVASMQSSVIYRGWR